LDIGDRNVVLSRGEINFITGHYRLPLYELSFSMKIQYNTIFPLNVIEKKTLKRLSHFEESRNLKFMVLAEKA
jgi:hypothetical protein